MSPVEWFYAQGDKQQGPVSAGEIKSLADTGKLRPDDLVWREGMEDWIPARKVKGLFESESAGPPPGQPAPAPPRGGAATAPPPAFEKSPAAFERAREGRPRHLFDFVLEFARGQFTGPFVGATARMFAACGHYGLYLAMLVVLLFSLLVGVKGNELNPILTGLAAVVILAVLQYAARRFVTALEKLNRSTVGKISSPLLPDCVSVLLGLGGVAMLIALSVEAIQTEQFLLILPAVATFIIWEYMAIVALNPEAMKLSVTSEATVGEEALGVFAFFLKLVLRTAPVAFGVGVVWGIIGFLFAVMMVFATPKTDLGVAVAMWAPSMATGVPLVEVFVPAALSWSTGERELAGAAVAGTMAGRTLVGFAAVPLFVYLFFLFYHLAIDVLRAVLAIPGKLDRLRSEEEKET